MDPKIDPKIDPKKGSSLSGEEGKGEEGPHQWVRRVRVRKGSSSMGEEGKGVEIMTQK